MASNPSQGVKRERLGMGAPMAVLVAARLCLGWYQN